MTEGRGEDARGAEAARDRDRGGRGGSARPRRDDRALPGRGALDPDPTASGSARGQIRLLNARVAPRGAPPPPLAEPPRSTPSSAAPTTRSATPPPPPTPPPASAEAGSAPTARARRRSARLGVVPGGRNANAAPDGLGGPSRSPRPPRRSCTDDASQETVADLLRAIRPKRELGPDEEDPELRRAAEEAARAENASLAAPPKVTAKALGLRADERATANWSSGVSGVSGGASMRSAASQHQQQVLTGRLGVLADQDAVLDRLVEQEAHARFARRKPVGGRARGEMKNASRGIKKAAAIDSRAGSSTRGSRASGRTRR